MPSIDYETNIHRRWISLIEENSRSPHVIINKVKRKLDQGLMTQEELIELSYIYQDTPKVFIQALLYSPEDR